MGDKHVRNIIRVEHNKEKPYLCVSKQTVSDPRLTFETRGFLLYLLCKPDAWDIRPDQLAEECGIGRATVYRLLKDLINAGYVRRQDVRRNAQGKFQQHTEYRVYEERIDGVIANQDAAQKEESFDDSGIPF